MVTKVVLILNIARNKLVFTLYCFCLGLSDEDRQTLIKNIHIIYHGAASVRFDDSLSQALIMNTRGTREVCLLAQQMKELKVSVDNVHMNLILPKTDTRASLSS